MVWCQEAGERSTEIKDGLKGGEGIKERKTREKDDFKITYVGLISLPESSNDKRCVSLAKDGFH